MYKHGVESLLPGLFLTRLFLTRLFLTRLFLTRLSLTGLFLTGSFLSFFATEASAATDWLDETKFKLSGFGTVAASYTSLDEADYRTRIEQTEGVGKTDHFTYDLDSLAALQFDAEFTRNVTTTVQVVSRNLDGNSFKPAVEWANVKYEYADGAFIRAGRIVAPTFANADIRNLGYAQTTLRPPSNVYLLNPITYIDGADTGYRFYIDDVGVRLGLSFGKSDMELFIPESGTSQLDYETVIFNVLMEQDSSQWRLLAWKLSLDVENTLLALFDEAVAYLATANIPGAVAVSDEVNYSKTIDAYYYGASYVYDDLRWKVATEIVQRQVEGSAVQDAIGGYMFGGFHLGNWTPFLAYSRVRSGEDEKNLRIDTSGYSGLIQLFATPVNQYLESLSTNRSNVIESAGIRWDPLENIAVKFQIDHIKKTAGSGGDVFVLADDAFAKAAGSVDVYGLSLDYVF